MKKIIAFLSFLLLITGLSKAQLVITSGGELALLPLLLLDPV
jgi:hypothetical protein